MNKKQEIIRWFVPDVLMVNKLFVKTLKEICFKIKQCQNYKHK